MLFRFENAAARANVRVIREQATIEIWKKPEILAPVRGRGLTSGARGDSSLTFDNGPAGKLRNWSSHESDVDEHDCSWLKGPAASDRNQELIIDEPRDLLQPFNIPLPRIGTLSP